MATIEIRDVSVRYGDKRILKDISFTVHDGECCAVLGPSACGKTTLARAMCGFIKLDAGEIEIGGHLVSSRPRNLCIAPEKRNIGVVFQDYAVWPHMTVFENVFYPLKKQRVEKSEALNRAHRALEQVKMWEYRDRLPSQLSGGQQQRVAIARALVVGGDVIIFDEPITNLDANLREEMRFEIKELQRKTSITVLYITQDQSDAMAIADHIVILDPEGNIRQIGTPEVIYKEPADSFVYRFLGTSNFIPLLKEADALHVATGEGKWPLALGAPARFKDGQSFYLASRPMDIELKEAGMIPGRIRSVTFLGNTYDYRVEVGDLELRVQQGAYEAMKQGVWQPGMRCGLDFTNPRFYDEVERRSAQ